MGLIDVEFNLFISLDLLFVGFCFATRGSLFYYCDLIMRGFDDK